MVPFVWRFLLLGDPTVSMFIVRDSESRLRLREKAAANEWISSGKPFHSMRDHPLHNDPMMGGNSGGNNDFIGYQTGYNITLDLLRLGLKKAS